MKILRLCYSPAFLLFPSKILFRPLKNKTMGLMLFFQLAGLVGSCQETPSFVLDKYIFNGSSGWGGGIQAVEFDNNRVYVGGDFTHVGPPTGNVAIINTKTGRLFAGFPEMMTGNVTTSIPDGDGGWFIVTSEVGGDLYYILPDGKVKSNWGQYIDPQKSVKYQIPIL